MSRCSRALSLKKQWVWEDVLMCGTNLRLYYGHTAYFCQQKKF